MDINTLIKILRHDEGDVLTIYKDSLGYYTVGIGHLLTKKNDLNEAIRILDELVGRSTKGHITEEESSKILENDINDFMKYINASKVISPVFNKLSATRKLGLFSMCFQMGVPTVETFKNSLRYIDNEQWDLAEQNLKKSLWYRQTKNRATRVINIITKEDLIPYKLG